MATSWRFGRLVDADRRRLLERPRPPHPPLVTLAMLAGLPEPAKRYLRYAGVARGFSALLDGLVLQRVEEGDSYRRPEMERRALAFLDLVAPGRPSKGQE